MSLDITLIRKGKITYDDGNTFEDYEEVVFDRNITHNLNTMASKAGHLYEAMWRPEELQISQAKQAVLYLEVGVKELKDNPSFYKQFNPSNGWGSYEGLLECAERYLEACIMYPDAIIKVSR